MSVDVLVEMELKRKAALLGGRGSVRDRDAASLAGLTTPAPPELPVDAFQLPEGFISAHVSAETYRAIYAAFSSHEGQVALEGRRMTPEGIDEARAYVAGLMDVDLGSISVEIIPLQHWQDGAAEGKHYRAGVDQHFILMPERAASPVEVLVHEFGHAAHAILQRQNGEYPFFYVSSSTAEFIAHFCQYRYILDHLSKHHFLIALGQLVASSYALSIFASGITGDFEAYLASPQAQEIHKGWSLPILQAHYELFSQNEPYWVVECNRAISLILALLLIDDLEGVRRYASLDRIDRPLGEKLVEAFPGALARMSFADINAKIQELLARFE
jgi:hypothetical protein